MLKEVVTAVFGTRFARELKRVQPVIDAIHQHEKRLGELPHDAIRAQTDKLRAQLRE